MLHIAFFSLFLLGCCAYALWRGGAPERWAAGLEIAAVCAAGLIQLANGTGQEFADVSPAIFVIEGLFSISLCVIALTADRFWPMVATGIQLAYLVVHLSRAVAPEMLPYGYAWGIQIWGWPKVILFAAATRRHQKRLAQYGSDPSWSRPRRLSL